MRLFADRLAFVDLETTGTAAATDAITEIGIVRVEADADGGARMLKTIEVKAGATVLVAPKLLKPSS